MLLKKNSPPLEKYENALSHWISLSYLWYYGVCIAASLSASILSSAFLSIKVC